MSTDALLRARLDAIYASRDRAQLAPTITSFLEVPAEFPDDPAVSYEVGGAYDAKRMVDRSATAV